MNGSTSGRDKYISLPEGKIGMVFMLGGNASINNKKIKSTVSSSHFFGLIQEPTFIELSSEMETFAIVFKSGGLFHFLPDLPVNELASSSVLLSDVYGDQINYIEELLHENRSMSHRMAIVESFLFSNLKQHVDSRLNLLTELVIRKKGQLTISNLSNWINVSPRQLQNITKEGIGLSPKKFLKLIRFKNVLDNLPNENENQAQYANRMGYYDESHFIHEFKTLGGMTPNRYFKNQAYISDFYNFKRLMIE